MIKRSGFSWQSYGLTRLHLLGVSIADGVLSLAGILFLLAALFGYFTGAPGEEVTMRLLFAGVCFLAVTAIILYSLFTVHFFVAADRLGLLDRE